MLMASTANHWPVTRDLNYRDPGHGGQCTWTFQERLPSTLHRTETIATSPPPTVARRFFRKASSYITLRRLHLVLALLTFERLGAARAIPGLQRLLGL